MDWSSLDTDERILTHTSTAAIPLFPPTKVPRRITRCLRSERKLSQPESLHSFFAKSCSTQRCIEKQPISGPRIHAVEDIKSSQLCNEPMIAPLHSLPLLLSKHRVHACETVRSTDLRSQLHPPSETRRPSHQLSNPSISYIAAPARLHLQRPGRYAPVSKARPVVSSIPAYELTSYGKCRYSERSSPLPEHFRAPGSMHRSPNPLDDLSTKIGRYVCSHSVGIDAAQNANTWIRSWLGGMRPEKQGRQKIALAVLLPMTRTHMSHFSDDGGPVQRR